MNLFSSDLKQKEAIEADDAGTLSLEQHVHHHDEIEGSEFLDDALRMKEQSLENSNADNREL